MNLLTDICCVILFDAEIFKVLFFRANTTTPLVTTNIQKMASDNKYKYRIEILQMMFVLGEANDPPIETTSIIEDIVRGQVIEILRQSTKQQILEVAEVLYQKT